MAVPMPLGPSHLAHLVLPAITPSAFLQTPTCKLSQIARDLSPRIRSTPPTSETSTPTGFGGGGGNTGRIEIFSIGSIRGL